MPNFPKFWDRQHVSANDLRIFINDIEESRRSLIKDIDQNYSSSVLTSNYGTSSCLLIEDPSSPSLSVFLMWGIGYSKLYNRVETKELITGELQTSSTNTQIQVDYPISGVNEVYTGTEGIGLNYYTGGSFDALNRIITTGTPLPSANSQVYINYYKMPSYTLTDSPTGINSLTVTRIDLIYLEYNKKYTTPLSIDFIDENRMLYQEVVNTRQEDSFTIKRVKGVQSITPGYPVIPNGDIIPIAYIHFRNNTTAIYNSDQSTIQTAWIEDCRQTI